MRRDEYSASTALACYLIDRVRGHDLRAPATPGTDTRHTTPEGVSSGVGVVEGWRGTIVHRIEITAAGRIGRAKIVGPSWFNWPALPVALNGDSILPDSPLTNKSFNLSYSGNDL